MYKSQLWGKPTDLPWGVVFGGAAGDIPRHPSQLYEACLEGIVLFAVLYLLSRRKKTPSQGSIMGTFVLGYGICLLYTSGLPGSCSATSSTPLR